MKPTYILQMFYSSLKENADRIRMAREIILKLSGGDFVILGYGQQTMSIIFTSDQPLMAIAADTNGIVGEHLHSVVLEISKYVGGGLYPAAKEWLVRHPHLLAKREKRPAAWVNPDEGT